jgi:hypothetical protein
MNHKNTTHNLNINTYSLDELLGIFDITSSFDISIDDLKRAKRKVLMLHPDKSNLPSDYFLFYKKALDIIVKFYEHNNRQNQPMTEEATNYSATNLTDFNKTTTNKIKSTINGMSAGDFQQKFNDLFEQNMSDKPGPNKNEWFSNHAPTFQIDENVSTKNMGEVLETVKQKNQGIVKYRGVENLYAGSNSNGTNFYDGADDEDESVYLSSDPFSKLKYDDLRRVHKDQTVFAVSETDFQKVQQYTSVNQYRQARDNPANMTPLEKQRAEQMLAEQERAFKEKMMHKQHQSNLKTTQYAEKNRSVLSHFLQLDNR